MLFVNWMTEKKRRSGEFATHNVSVMYISPKKQIWLEMVLGTETN